VLFFFNLLYACNAIPSQPCVTLEGVVLGESGERTEGKGGGGSGINLQKNLPSVPLPPMGALGLNISLYIWWWRNGTLAKLQKVIWHLNNQPV